MTVDISYANFATNETYQGLIVELLDQAAVQDGASVIDLGAGSGAVSIALLERISPASLLLVDPDEAAVAAARSKLGERARYVVAPAEDLARHAPAGQADHVLVGNAVHLFDDLPRSFEGVYGA